jgi:serine/threonine protein kinase
VLERWIGPYPVGELIGWGGFASVYRTRGRDGAPLVLKVADQSGQGSRTFTWSVRPALAVRYHTGSHGIGGRLPPDEVREMFRAEAAALRAAAGHRMPRLIDEQLTEDGSPVLVMEELTAPWSLELAPIQDFARILDACADLQRAGIGEFWRQGAGHGDLKPEHLFLDADGEFMFIDPAYRSALFGTVTPAYNPNPYEAAAARDVCSAAVMLYQRLTGDVPWATPDWRAMALSQLSGMADARALPSRDAWLTPALPAVAGWAKLVFGWLVADDGSGASYITSDHARSCQPRWLGDHLAAAAQLRAAIDGHTPELA